MGKGKEASPGTPKAGPSGQPASPARVRSHATDFTNTSNVADSGLREYRKEAVRNFHEYVSRVEAPQVPAY